VSAVVGCALITFFLVAFVLIYRKVTGRSDPDEDPEDQRRVAA
jgi:hypothetical protein